MPPARRYRSSMRTARPARFQEQPAGLRTVFPSPLRRLRGFLGFARKAPFDERNDGRERLGRVGATRTKMQRFPLGGLEAHHLHRALGIDSRPGRGKRKFYMRVKA